MSSTPTNPSFTNGHPRDEGSLVEEAVSPIKETNHEDGQTSTQKKKKKKKSKKPKPTPLVTGPSNESTQEPKQPVLCISRNKHWKYISSYHGPWLQLPLELLESLLMLNMDPTNFLPRDERMPTPPNTRRTVSPSTALSLRNPNTPKSVPPPIDPGVFRSVTTIRRLIDEASDLAVRAASGLSASALGALRSPTIGNNPWGPNQMKNGLGDQGSGRGSGMSSTRTHRLRVLAVQKLAAAYKADEIAASVMVMQGASALDDLAERVLKVDPNDPDAKYVHFFHEKIPSSPRQLAESTTTQVLDELIEVEPSRLHYFRTRGIVRCFRDEYTLAIKDFTHALKESRALRKARAVHHSDGEHKQKNKGRKRNEGKTNGQAPPNGTSVPDASPSDTTPPLRLHPSVGPDAPEPLETQVLFLRAAAYLQNAVHLIEDTILEIEGVEKQPAQDALELKLSLLEKGRYGGITTEGPDGPLGSKSGNKLQAYRKALAVPSFRQNIATLLRKSIRDHERFMASFDTVDDALPTFDGDIAQRVETAFLLSEALRPGSQSPPPPPPENPNIFTTYHPLLVESYFSVLLCYFLLGDFVSLLPAYQRAAALVDGLEGYPVFLPARSMAQAEFTEILERLVTTWGPGLQPHTLALAYQQRQLIELPSITTATVVLAQSPLPSSATLVELQSDTSISTRTTSPINEDEGTSQSTSQSQSQIQETGQETLALSLIRPNGVNGINDNSSEQLLSPDVPYQNGSVKRQDSQATQASQGSQGSPRLHGVHGVHDMHDAHDVQDGSSDDPEHQRMINLDCLRILLAPVAKRQRTRAEAEAAEKANKSQKKKKKNLSISIPLHSPRVDIVLAYVAAVHLPEFDV